MTTTAQAPVSRTAGLVGGVLVALFEVAYQFGIAGTGVAGAAALLYIAPVLVAVLAQPLLGEQLTALRVVLPLAGHPPVPPHTPGAWLYVLLLSLGSVLAANFLFFAAVKRIDAAPTAVAATIEPVVGTLLALTLFNQQLTVLGWIGLLMVVGGVALGYLRETRPTA